MYSTIEQPATNGRIFLLVSDAVQLPPVQAEKIRQLSPRIELLQGNSKANLRDAHVIYTSNAAFNPAEAPALCWVQTNSVAVNHLRNVPIASSGIPIANVRGAYAIAVAECATGLMLALTRRLHVCQSLQQRRRWPTDKLSVRGENCHGKTLGIIGYGSAGRHIARIARALGMRVIVCKRRPEIKSQGLAFNFSGVGDPEGTIPDAWYGPGELMEMLQQCDVAVVTLPLTDTTQGLIGKRELEALAGNKYVVNVGRGGVIDEAALIDALQSGQLAGAGLDVFATEPLPEDSLLWELPNVIILSHIASYTENQAYLAAEVLIENLARFLSDRPLLNLVNMQDGY